MPRPYAGLFVFLPKWMRRLDFEAQDRELEIFMANDIVLTPAKKAEIEARLHYLRSTEMPELSERIRQARDLGDLSENFDYQDAKRHQGFVNGEIANLQALLDRGRVMENATGTEFADMGLTVNLRDTEFDDEFSVTIVGDYGADQNSGEVSMSSPIGKALMGRKVGDKVDVVTPEGTTTYEILAIS